MGVFILALLVISTFVICIVFLVVAVFIGRSFNQIGNQAPPTDQKRRRPEGSR